MSDFQVGAPRRGSGSPSGFSGATRQENATVSAEDRSYHRNQGEAEAERPERRGRVSSEDVAARQAARRNRPEPDADRGAPAAPAAVPAAPVVAAPAVPTPVRPTVAPGQAAQYNAQSAAGAADQRAAYDAYTRQAMGASPADAMKMAQAAAAQTAQTESDAAVRQAAKAAKTSGAMGGQAALAATGKAADAYGAGMARGQQQYFDTTQLGAQLGSEAASRLSRAAGTEAAQEASRLGAETSMYGTDVAAQSSRYATDAASEAAKKAANQQMFGNILGTVGGVAALFSDRNLKEDIRPASFADGLDRIKSYTYRYKGGDRPEAGVMAQDLEKTPMAPAVMETPKGKMIDTRRLSSMNTAALGEHEKRLKDIERMVSSLGEIRRK